MRGGVDDGGGVGGGGGATTKDTCIGKASEDTGTMARAVDGDGVRDG